MKFVIATYGTEGDARPFAALCRGLMDAGHEARLLADAATLGRALSISSPPARYETERGFWARGCAQRTVLLSPR